jgi:hypothetical protein
MNRKACAFRYEPGHRSEEPMTKVQVQYLGNTYGSVQG